MNIFEYNRIMILGNNGSGKSFLAKKISDITGLPLIHLDVEFWQPNWGMPTKEEWRQKNEEFVSKEKWIIDGMCSHGGTIEIRYKVADLVILLDINRLVCLSGVIKRNGKKRSETTAHTNEKFDMRFIQFCKGIWSFPKTRKLDIMELHRKYPDKFLFVIKSRKEMGKLLRQWENEKQVVNS